mgnify:CR=1 FL=1
MRQGRRTTSPSLLAGGEQAEQRTGLDWGSALVGERLIAAARLAAAMHMAGDIQSRAERSTDAADTMVRARS